jgi:excisionase family DNA binding protein
LLKSSIQGLIDMSKYLFRGDGPTYYSVRDAAWILGVHQSTVCRMIRTGVVPTVGRRSRLVVPASALRQMLGDAP